MSFGKNLQLLRKMHRGMTQEELAEYLKVSRQAVSRWELEAAIPEMDKLIEICDFFSCSLDELIRTDMGYCAELYSNIRTENVDAFQYIAYTVISQDPETDAITHMEHAAVQHGLKSSQIIGWDFPFVSPEQTNVLHMHGYTAALMQPVDIPFPPDIGKINTQEKTTYAAITIREPSSAPFRIIPNAYKTLVAYIHMNGWKVREHGEVIGCFEKEYTVGGTDYMDVYIAIQ